MWGDGGDASGQSAHPRAEALLWFVDRPHSLAPDEHEAIATHVADCASCRDEIQALRTLDLRALTRPQPPAEPEPSIRLFLGAPRDGRRVRLGRAQPGLALAVLLLVPVAVFHVSTRPTPPPAAPSESTGVPPPQIRSDANAISTDVPGDPAAANGTAPITTATDDAGAPGDDAGAPVDGSAPLRDVFRPAVAPRLPDARPVDLRTAGTARTTASDDGTFTLRAPALTTGAAAVGDVQIVDTASRQASRHAATIEDGMASAIVPAATLRPGSYQVEVTVAGVLAIYRLRVDP